VICDRNAPFFGTEYKGKDIGVFLFFFFSFSFWVVNGNEVHEGVCGFIYQMLFFLRNNFVAFICIRSSIAKKNKQTNNISFH